MPQSRRIVVPLALLALPLPAVAQTIRLGVLAHDVPILGEQHEHGADLNAEVDFATPVPAEWLSGVAPDYRWLLTPAPHMGVEANTVGDTSQLYIGLTWTADLDTGGTLWPDHAVFVAIGFGPAFNNGDLHATSNDHLSLGAHVLFHPALELGYRITTRWSVSAYFDHTSNAGFARENHGLDNLGVRVGVGF
jgi:hypothetical protein